MILGIYDPTQSAQALQSILTQACENSTQQIWADSEADSEADSAIALVWQPTGIATLDEATQPYQSANTVSVFEGKLYNLEEIQTQLENTISLTPAHSGQAIGELYERCGDDLLAQVNGKFAFAVWDRQQKRLLLGRDRLGIQSLFYTTIGSRLIFSTSLKALIKVAILTPGSHAQNVKQLDPQAILDYLLYCYNPGDNTFFKNIYKLPASNLLKADGSSTQLQPYWQLSFTEVEEKTERQYRTEIPALIEDAVRLRIDNRQPPGVLLSGGIDSSSMVALASKVLASGEAVPSWVSRTQPNLRTFSFRCHGKSYDESQYARLVAREFNTTHTEVPYEPNSLTHLAKAAAAMDEPFCDIGIEIATFLLGNAAKDKVSYVFSGEGGDELFGGHPVYTADKTAAYIDRIPKFLLRPLTALLQKIPDTDQKKNLQVKLKRVAYSLSFPAQLLSHRWRIYYNAQELSELCTDSLLGSLLGSLPGDHSSKTLSNPLSEDVLFDTMLKRTDKAAGPDILSRCLSSDYWTLVNFYLRRLELLKTFGIENRLPLLDHRLVEYAAKIPSDLKLRGFSDTKYIYKQALKGILPDDILFNRPKLGHSVPMKNWMREKAAVKDWITDILSSESFHNRNLFKPAFVQQLLTEHFSKAHNHSHRIWALVVLELWLRNNLDD